ncbi:hypothetical protein QJQ45_014842 [Haematococcus lacustris]|nr:hypothetical protein QJQ45_014842 [Haematococcus lacustris]
MTPQPRRPRARRHAPGLPAKREADGAADEAATGAAAGAVKAEGGAADEVSGEGEGKAGPGQQRQVEVGMAGGRPARRVTRSMTVDERAQGRQAAEQKDAAKKQEEKVEEEEEEEEEEKEEKKEEQLPPILGSYASVKNMMSTWHCRQVHRAKCWLKALQDIESQLHVNGQTPFLQLGTWLLGWTASGYGANIVQPCCACNRECCPVERNARGCPLQLGMSRPILYCPVVATFQLGTYDPRKHPPYKWEYVRMLGVTFACSPACAEAREPARGLQTSSPQAHRTYDPSKVVADPRLLMALTMAKQGGQPVAQFKTFMRYMKREPWAGFTERLSDNLRSLFESAIGEPKKPARAPKKPARAPMKPVSEKPSRPRSAAAGKSGPPRSRKRPAESDSDSDSDSD